MEHISNTQTLQRFSNLAVNNHNSVKSLNVFKPDELVMIRGQEYPKVAGRLRLAHESNASISIATEIVQYDEKIAVIKAVCNTVKGSFSGYGMSSVDRDIKLASAILELAETRAIARSLRFAGYGVEYTGAEEMSHLEAQGHNGTSGNMTSTHTNYTGNAGGYSYAPPKLVNNTATVTTPSTQPPQSTQPVNNYPPANNTAQVTNTQSEPQNNNVDNNGSDQGRLSSKQYKFILSLMGNSGKNKQEMDQVCVSNYGATLQYLSRKSASQLIESLIQK